ncbi:MAG: metal-sensitive transcriptional regulator [Ahrensia sp.]|nr:metal-sensitive transcriptional regulator [Ahrensia sp.]
MHANKAKTLDRLKRLEGQVRGVARMVEDDRYCVDILNQTAAIRAALKGVEKLIIADHADHCIEHAISSGDEANQRQKFRELVDIVGRTIS